MKTAGRAVPAAAELAPASPKPLGRSERDMPNLPASECVESRDGKVCIAGTRIGLDVLIYDFRRGDTPEGILQAYPSIGSLAKVYGAITFILEHPRAIESYLQEQEVLVAL